MAHFTLKLQYLYLHEVVAEATHAGSSPLDQQLFQEYIQELLKIGPKNDATNMQIQYEVKSCCCFFFYLFYVD